MVAKRPLHWLWPAEIEARSADLEGRIRESLDADVPLAVRDQAERDLLLAISLFFWHWLGCRNGQATALTSSINSLIERMATNGADPAAATDVLWKGAPVAPTDEEIMRLVVRQRPIEIPVPRWPEPELPLAIQLGFARARLR
jgi:hypothetical protein